MTPFAKPFVALLTALVLAGSVSARSGDAEAAHRAQKAVAESVRSLRLQTDLPGGDSQAAESKADAKSGRGVGERAGGDSGQGISPNAAQTILWIAILVFLAVLLLTIAENLRLTPWTRKRRGVEPGKTAARAAAVRLEAAQSEAESLAGNGDFAGAMHVLLLQSVAEMRRRLGVSFASSLTSREILRRAGLGPRAEAAFADIVGRVEVSYFGTHDPGPEEYAACRDSYAALAGALRGEDAA